jgi:hypothetical protein
VDRTQPVHPLGPEVIHETTHYVVVVERLSGPDTTPEELRIRYVIREKGRPVVAGTTGLWGEAINMAIQAEGMWTAITEHLAEEAAANATPALPTRPPLPTFPGLQL